MVPLLAGVLWQRGRNRRRDHWTPEQIADWQAERLTQLRDHARRHSPFYREHHRGVERSPLSELPPLTKGDLVSQWDRLVTAPGLRLADVKQRLSELETGRDEAGRPWRGRWWAAATAGTTDERAVVAWDEHEWVHILASYARVNDWANVKVGPRHRVPTAIVSTRNPVHQSAVVGASLDNPLVPTLRLEAAQPLHELATALNRFQPRLLVCYASMLGPLAEAQRTGLLRIAPEKVITASEEQLPAARQAAIQAWGVDVINTYAATETATIASSCPQGSLHLYEDLVIAEPVDNEYRPVPDGALADRLLVTVLFSRTLPLIRYELTDSIRLATSQCACGLPFRRLAEVAGRTDGTLTLAAPDGSAVRVRPEVFHQAIGPIAEDGWQVRHTPSELQIRIVDPDGTVDTAVLSTRVRAALVHAGASSHLPLTITRIGDLERTKLGKAPLIAPWQPPR